MHAKHAIIAGLDILETTNNIQEKLREMNLPAVRVGVGVNTGMMDVGDMGSEFRRAYTVLGDAVNLASRLESLTKYYGVGMIVGEESIIGQSEFTFRLLDKVMVKGKHKGIAIYEPLGFSFNVQPQALAELAQYENALTAYYAKKWEVAKNLFNELQLLSPTRVLYHIYLSRIETFMNDPPPEEWDGVWQHHEK